MYGTSFMTWIKQQEIISKFLNTSQWINIQNEFLNNRNNQLKTKHSIEDILHIIIIPIYKEDSLIIENTLQSLAEQNVSMLIGFALEEREVNSHSKYDDIIHKYEKKFIGIIKTIHPDNLKNEIPGKGSNCNYSAQMLIKYYEENLEKNYPYVMITSCDCDSIWYKNYFLYLNYLCTKNDLENFNYIIYVPNITNLKNFQSNHILSNWMSAARSIVTHGHFRRLNSIRCFTSEYHLPLYLLKKIDYWDCDLVHEDVHMSNKLLILNEKCLLFKKTYLPCDNQTPTNPNSISQCLIVLWNQSLRWNLFIYDLYYLFHQLLLNIFQKKSYKNFQTNSWKILQQIFINYENLFYFFIVPISNNLFWILYINLFYDHSYNNITSILLNYIQPIFMITQGFLAILHTCISININNDIIQNELYSWKKYVTFLFGLNLFCFFAVIYQGFNVIVAWIHTLKGINEHSESTSKVILD